MTPVTHAGSPPTHPLPRALLAAALLACAARPATAQSTPSAPAAPPAPPAWVQRSNAHAQLLLEPFARFAPEQAGHFGIPGHDEDILDLQPGYVDRQLAASRQAIAALEQRLGAEQDPAVRQDLEIMIQAAKLRVRGAELAHEHEMPYRDLNLTVFMGLRALLDEQVPAERRLAALVRLRRYAGMERGYTPIAELAQARIRERMDPGLLAPVKDDVERNLASGPTYVAGIAKLLERYRLKGWQKPYARLKQQLAAYDEFVRQEVLPRARTDFRRPPELYAYDLEQAGVDMPVEELQSRAKVAFKEIQAQMQTVAGLLARQRGWTITDYRDAIRELKKSQLVGEAILPHYQARIREIEEIIRREQIVTLPSRDMLVRLADEAESAAIPAPNMRPPRMIGNTGEKGTFVLPLRIPGKAGERKQFDDFTYEAASWTLTAHEGRPGHELQFASVVERGVSIARALFAFNSVNVEGWGLYAEAELQPYEPLEGQLVALQNRLMRAARAFLDPGLQLGTITREEAYRTLREDVVLSDAMATQEVQRYTFLAPGQATAYFVGYVRMLELRADAERQLGARFDRKSFNDFVLAQGLLTPALLRKAVMEQFVPAQLQKSER